MTIQEKYINFINKSLIKLSYSGYYYYNCYYWLSDEQIIDKINEKNRKKKIFLKILEITKKNNIVFTKQYIYLKINEWLSEQELIDFFKPAWEKQNYKRFKNTWIDWTKIENNLIADFKNWKSIKELSIKYSISKPTVTGKLVYLWLYKMKIKK